MTAAIFPTNTLAHDHLHFDVLQSELVVDGTDKRQRALTRHLGATQFNPGAFPRQLRMPVCHFAIENEGSIGIEFFLELMQLLIAANPGPRLVNYQQHFILHCVEGEEIDDPGIHYFELRC